jgi:DNA-binding MarR family transcriptional regulator
LEAWAGFFELYAVCVRQIEKSLAGTSPLSLDEYDVLLALKRAPEQRLRLSELADKTVYTRSGITRIVTRFEKESYLVREVCPGDRRGAFARLTQRSDDALRRVWSEYRSAVLNVFGTEMRAEDAIALKRIFNRMLQRLSPPDVVRISRAPAP